MRKFKSSDLSKNRAYILEAAAKEGAIIQERNTNGRVRREFMLIERELAERLAKED